MSPASASGVTTSPALRRVLAGLVFVGPFALVAWFVRGFVSDDALIVLRYAERLAAGDGFTWNDGERVNGVTSLLLTAVAALGAWLGVPSLLAARVFAALGAIAAALCVVHVARRHAGGDLYAWVLGGLTLACAPLSVWVFGGLEGPVFAAVLAWSVVVLLDGAAALSTRRAFLVGVLAAMLCVVRADGPGLALVVVAGACWQHRHEWRRTLVRVGSLPILTTVLTLSGHHWYFGSPFPNTAAVKFSFTPALLAVGAWHIADFVRVFAPLLTLVVVALVASARRGSVATVGFPLAVIAIWLAYLVWIGGDWMPAFRHYGIVVVLGVVVALRTGLFAAGSRPRSFRWRVALVFALMVSMLASVTTRASGTARDASRWMEQCVEGSTALAALFEGLDPLLAVESAGCPPLVTGFRSLDMLGLTDAHLGATGSGSARPVTWNRWQDQRNGDPFGASRDVFIVGHGNGDGDYVWAAEPDLFVLCDPVGVSAEGCFRSWQEMRERFPFEERYQVLALALTGSSGSVDGNGPWKVWVRHDGGVTGVRRSESRVTVPAYLLARDRDSQLVDVSSQWRVALAGTRSTRTPAVALEPGLYRIEGLPSGVSVTVAPDAPSSAGARVLACARHAAGVLQVERSCRVTLTLVNPTTDSVLLGDLSLLASS